VSDLLIQPVVGRLRSDAMELTFSRLPAEERAAQAAAALASLDSGRIPPEGLLGAWRGQRLVGVVYASVQPGRTAMVWPPRCVAEEPDATALELLQTACRWLGEYDLSCAVALVRPGEKADEAALRQTGFDFFADLLYLVALRSDFPEPGPTAPIEFEPYAPDQRGRLIEVMEGTFVQTLDCPRLNEIRRTEDVLESYRGEGDFDPDLWLLVRHEGRHVGCLLMADSRECDTMEVLYMGLLPWCRGRGWGVKIAQYAQRRAARAGRSRLAVAVDESNLPALDMYAAAGFRAWDRRRAYLKRFS
jgi:N-acetylglutamate synthase-like GNAT family acetyltransferase